MHIGVLKNQNADSVDKWVIACEKLGVNYRIIDLTSHDWLNKIRSERFDFLVHRPPGDIERFKALFDERLYILCEELNYMVFPSYRETLIYENKRMLNYFLNAREIPHPTTQVFYNYKESLEYISHIGFPVVAKSNIGAAGSGVRILKDEEVARKYLYKAFKGKGIQRRFGPNPQVGSPRKWLHKAIKNPGLLKSKLALYSQISKDRQYGYVILQEFVQHEFEWRVAKIGESYFAYRKHRVGEKASGAKNLSYENPPLDLLDLVRKIASDCQINSAAFDLFHTENGYLVNEIQTIFGHIRDHILEVKGIPGRYVHQEGKWVFEEGEFNSNESFDLRLKVAIQLFNDKREK